MYFLSLSYYILALFINKNFKPVLYDYSKRGNCDINITKDSDMDINRIAYLLNISKLIHFYESPGISMTDKLEKIEDMNNNSIGGFYISKGGLFDNCEEFQQNCDPYYL